MLSTLEVQEYFSLTIQSISRSFVRSFARPPALSLSFTLVYCSVLCFRRLSVSLRWEKKRNNFKLLSEHTYAAWPCSVPPLSSSCIPPSTCRDNDRQRRGRSETAYKVKQIFRFLFFCLLSFILNSLYWTISAPPHSTHTHAHISVVISVTSKRERILCMCNFLNVKCMNGGDRNKNMKERENIVSSLELLLLRSSGPIVVSHQRCHCSVTRYSGMMIRDRRSIWRCNLSTADCDYQSTQLGDEYRSVCVCVCDRQVFASNDDADKTDDKHQPIDCAYLR